MSIPFGTYLFNLFCHHVTTGHTKSFPFLTIFSCAWQFYWVPQKILYSERLQAINLIRPHLFSLHQPGFMELCSILPPLSFFQTEKPYDLAEQRHAKKEKTPVVGPAMEEFLEAVSGSKCLLTHTVNLWSWRTDAPSWQQGTIRLKRQSKKSQGLSLLCNSDISSQSH